MTLWELLAVLPLGLFVGVRLIFLAPTRLGWINYLPNVVSEFFVKRLQWSRSAVELAVACVGLIGAYLAGAPLLVVALLALAAVSLECAVRLKEIQILTTAYTTLDAIGPRPAKPERTRGLAAGYPSPSTHPQLTLNLIGPFVERVPRYHLGALFVGRLFEMQLLIGNHTIVPTQTGIRVSVHASEHLLVERQFGETVSLLQPGGVHRLRLRCKVRGPGGSGTIRIRVEWGDLARQLLIKHDACIPAERARIVNAVISRYPAGCRSAFAWRGDMDLYDHSTLQSIAGLNETLRLAARYRMPQTMYLSTRLALDVEAARAWAAHYGIDRGGDDIPRFIEWLSGNVDLRHVCAYPFDSDKSYVLELGNHGHLHYGTDTAAAPENQWTAKSKIGAGRYPWVGADRSSFAEQRDNALEARRLCEKMFAFTPKSWAMPDRTNDEFTAAAMEAAGCEVVSDSNVRARHNVLLQPPPHHPDGTSVVELTKRYPGDPQHIFHLAMNLFWIHRAHRKGIPVVFMCHQHLRQFDGHVCERFTEYVLRYVLTRFHGDLHINTVYGLGKYWREVLSPQTRRLDVTVEAGCVRVRNNSDFDLLEMPLDIQLAGGGVFTELVSVSRGDEVSVSLPLRDVPNSKGNTAGLTVAD